MKVKLGLMAAVVLTLSLAYSSGAGAQVGSTTDILMGRVAGLIIAINDSAKLELTPDQIAKLQASGDAFKVKADSLIDKVANVVGDTTVKNPDPMTIFAKLGPSMTEARKLATQAINEAKAILTPAQWAKVPESIKTPGLRRGDGEGVRFERGGPGNE